MPQFFILCIDFWLTSSQFAAFSSSKWTSTYLHWKRIGFLLVAGKELGNRYLQTDTIETTISAYEKYMQYCLFNWACRTIICEGKRQIKIILFYCFLFLFCPYFILKTNHLFILTSLRGLKCSFFTSIHCIRILDTWYRCNHFCFLNYVISLLPFINLWINTFIHST